MVYFLLDLYYFYNTITSGPDFLKPESLILRNPILHRLFLSTSITDNLNKSILRLFLEDVSLPVYYYLYENVTGEILRDFQIKDNKGNPLVIISPSQNGHINPFGLTSTDMDNINLYLLNPRLEDMSQILSIFTGNKNFCKLYWFYRIYKRETNLNEDFFLEFKNTIRSLNSSQNLFIKLLEHIILKRVLTEVFNKNIIIQ